MNAAWPADTVALLQAENRELRHRVDLLLDEIHALREARHALTEQRDLARRVAVQLEQENHDLAQDVTFVPYRGEAS